MSKVQDLDFLIYWRHLMNKNNDTYYGTNGSSGYINPDGSGTYYGADGSSGYINPDGSGTYYGKDGSSAYINSDGSGTYYGADGSSGYINPDGSGTYYGKDGSSGYMNPDGSGTYYGADGSSGYMYSDGSTSYYEAEGRDNTNSNGGGLYNRKRIKKNKGDSKIFLSTIASILTAAQNGSQNNYNTTYSKKSKKFSIFRFLWGVIKFILEVSFYLVLALIPLAIIYFLKLYI